jgi:hypothetical protein
MLALLALPYTRPVLGGRSANAGGAAGGAGGLPPLYPTTRGTGSWHCALFLRRVSGSERPADLELAVTGALGAHRWLAVFASTSSSMWCVARHAECPLGFGLLGEALQVIVPIGLISARSKNKNGLDVRIWRTNSSSDGAPGGVPTLRAFSSWLAADRGGGGRAWHGDYQGLLQLAAL